MISELNDLDISWKKIRRGLPSETKKSTSYRAPTIEEIKELIVDPDRRIKANCLYNVLFRKKVGRMGLYAVETRHSHANSRRNSGRKTDWCTRMTMKKIILSSQGKRIML